MTGREPSSPAVVASMPNRLLATGIAAYDERFCGVERGSLVAFCATDAEAVGDLCGRAACAHLAAGASVGLADFRGTAAPRIARAGLGGNESEIKRHAQAGVSVAEIVKRTESWHKYDPAFAALIIVDIGDIASPLPHAATVLKNLARRLDVAVIVGSVAPEPDKDGRLLGDFAELPEPADVLLHLERRQPGRMFPPSFRLHVRKARTHETVSVAVRPDENRGWVTMAAG